jgi:hypothetical protein
MTSTRWSWVSAVVAVVVFAACSAADPDPVAGGDPAVPSVGSLSPPRAATEPLDTTNWTTYTSDQYGFKVGHPPDWNEIPASRSWESPDAGDPAPSRAHDTFQSPSDAVRVSAWQVPLDPGTSIESNGDIETWVEEYCEESSNTPCTGINDRAVELCLEKWDCHPGLLIPFQHDVQAFFSAGIYPADAMTVVAVWWAEDAPAVNQYGGSQRLLEAFLSTMAVWPASTPRDARNCYGRPPGPELDCPESG